MAELIHPEPEVDENPAGGTATPDVPDWVELPTGEGPTIDQSNPFE